MGWLVSLSWVGFLGRGGLVVGLPWMVGGIGWLVIKLHWVVGWWVGLGWLVGLVGCWVGLG